MAIGDYICCSRCETKLIYDGDQGNRRWWKEQFGSEVNIKCPKCAWVGLTDEERFKISRDTRPYIADTMRAHEEELKRRNT